MRNILRTLALLTLLPAVSGWSAAPAGPAAPSAEDSIKTLLEARLDIDALAGAGWDSRDLTDLAAAVREASAAVARLHAENPNKVAEALGGKNLLVGLLGGQAKNLAGTAANLMDGVQFTAEQLRSFVDHGPVAASMARGCLSHQETTYFALRGLFAQRRSPLQLRKIRIGVTPLLHNAVIVFPKGASWKESGVVFDGWIRQQSSPDLMTFRYQDWFGVMGQSLRIDPRLLDED